MRLAAGLRWNVADPGPVWCGRSAGPETALPGVKLMPCLHYPPKRFVLFLLPVHLALLRTLPVNNLPFPSRIERKHVAPGWRGDLRRLLLWLACRFTAV